MSTCNLSPPYHTFCTNRIGPAPREPLFFWVQTISTCANLPHASCFLRVCILCLQIRVLESQLAQLRSQAAEVEDKRTKLAQRQSAALDALSASTGRKMAVRSAAEVYHCCTSLLHIEHNLPCASCCGDGACMSWRLLSRGISNLHQH